LALEQVVIAVDGPSASGKSTVAQALARRLGFMYVDSGALYRAATWYALERGVDTADGRAVGEAVAAMSMEFFVSGGAVRFRVDGADLGEALRSDPVDEHVSPVATVPEVRKRVKDWLRGLVRLGALVMEGRDIGTAVFPEARHKFYLDADPAERARRRHAQAADGAPSRSVDAVRSSLQRRDKIDSGRRLDPLTVAEGAVCVDSTHLSVEDVVEFILQRIPLAAGGAQED